jgi:hypothetical protein
MCSIEEFYRIGESPISEEFIDNVEILKQILDEIRDDMRNKADYVYNPAAKKRIVTSIPAKRVKKKSSVQIISALLNKLTDTNTEIITKITEIYSDADDKSAICNKVYEFACVQPKYISAYIKLYREMIEKYPGTISEISARIRLFIESDHSLISGEIDKLNMEYGDFCDINKCIRIYYGNICVISHILHAGLVDNSLFIATIFEKRNWYNEVWIDSIWIIHDIIGLSAEIIDEIRTVIKDRDFKRKNMQKFKLMDVVEGKNFKY